MPSHADLPSLRATVRLAGKNSSDDTAWYDCKFYPYTVPGVSPVFAVTGGSNTIICRCVLGKDNAVELLQWFKDEDANAEKGLNSVEWSQAANGDPLVCVSGGHPKIKVLNVKTGKLVTTLTGHGDNILDLATSPSDPTILASASADHSIRIWTLDPAYQQQPTAAIVFGEGHKESVLALGFHRKGQYLLSGGQDTRVNLWMLPQNLEDSFGSDKPVFLHYPHFSTTELHTDYVDCVRFYNDLIISRASQEHKILLWKIDNFNSDASPPTSVPMPPSQVVQSNTPVSIPASQVSSTRSAWGGRFQRLLQFEQPDTEPFYVRLGLFHEAGMHPVLAAGNTKSKIFLWDLQRLEEAGVDESKRETNNTTTGISAGPAPTTLASTLALANRIRAESEISTTSNTSASAQSYASEQPLSRSSSKKSGVPKGGKSTAKNKRTDNLTTGIGDSFKSIKAHKTIEVPRVEFTTRQIAWSRGGEWCVAVGEHGMIAMMRRWEEGIPEPEV